MGESLSKVIELLQGVPQWDIVSTFVFIIAVKILLIKITTTKNIKGIPLADSEIRAQTFADDTSFAIKRETKSLEFCVKYIEAFKEISGLSANLDKTKVIPIGCHFNPKLKICQHLPLEWSADFKLLGIEIDNELSNLQTNFERVLIRCKTLINNWESRHLPLEGRISIAKSLLLSQFTYLSTVITITPDQINQAQTCINNYIQ